MTKEIERKWLLREHNVIDNIKRMATDKLFIQQRYFHEENTSNTVARIRQTYQFDENGKKFIVNSEITTKSGRGIERSEINVSIDHTLGSEIMLPTADHLIIEKVRYLLPLPGEGLTIEVDIYEGENAGLVHIEVEFPNLLAANSFDPLHWFGEEVTDDMRHTNAHLQLTPYKFWTVA